jgi:hypothetical protein
MDLVMEALEWGAAAQRTAQECLFLLGAGGEGSSTPPPFDLLVWLVNSHPAS